MSLIRLHVVAEGKTEREFVNLVLSTHLGHYGISTDARCVMTSREQRRKYSGGMSGFGKLRNDIVNWLREDTQDDARFTTMIDLYALPTDFPGWDVSRDITDPYNRVRMLEHAFASEIGDPRFIPYIQLHEFEALVFVDLLKLCDEFMGNEKQIHQLIEQLGNSISHNPELIDDGYDTAPSKRIAKFIPGYAHGKATVGPRIASAIGLQKLRASCPHFHEWMSGLEALGTSSTP